MKLRNKKTGEVKDVRISRYPDSAPILVSEITPDENGQTQGWAYDSLAKLNEEWEDYEEPKEYWYIDCYGMVLRSLYNGNEWDERRKQIGNYFETKEEAELVVEKLKAWERLKDTGCKPIMWKWKQDYPNDACYVEVVLKCQFDSGVHDRELDSLFGGNK